MEKADICSGFGQSREKRSSPEHLRENIKINQEMKLFIQADGHLQMEAQKQKICAVVSCPDLQAPETSIALPPTLLRVAGSSLTLTTPFRPRPFNGRTTETMHRGQGIGGSSTLLLRKDGGFVFTLRGRAKDKVDILSAIAESEALLVADATVGDDLPERAKVLARNWKAGKAAHDRSEAARERQWTEQTALDLAAAEEKGGEA